MARRNRPQPTPTVRLPDGFNAGYVDGPTTPDERQWALTAYIGQFLLWALPPAYVYVTKKRRSAYARHHGRQALNLALTTGIGVSVSLFLTQWFPVLQWVAYGWVALAMGLVVFSATRVNRGAWHKLPALVAWPLIK
ncbi:DUF4870 domain-containing protein [Actinocorallia sp. API 0066]|uniref:DUF4870 domain-containing protein n=1 Tax=Actinocorallia sp. API 0066 TaxID=2896846 RepID=UPI001E611E51|nr:DUF4870 domain-containing protein [Actinocorallia sp. API 0066]MCD0453546.1 DUF4870 domain-containing protein [Actinocorallia sp. API 0066]